MTALHLESQKWLHDYINENTGNDSDKGCIC